MATNVTVLGVLGTTVTIPYTSAVMAAGAQAALATVSKLASLGALTQQNWPGGIGTAAAASPFGGEVVTIAASNNLGILPGNYVSLVDTSPSVTAAIGSLQTSVVASGPDAVLVYQNQASGAQIFLGGGINYITEVFAGSSATIDLDASTSVLGSGAAIVDSSTAGSSSTVNAFANTLVDVIAGGNVVIGAGSGTIVAEVTAPTGAVTIPAAVTITGNGGAGSQIDYIPNGGQAFINPFAENVVILDNGPLGSETLAGGAGTATVFGGEGRFTGGSAGGNFLISGTVNGGATLIGGGSGDYLQSYGVNNQVIAGNGAETLVGGNGLALLSGTATAPAGGQTFTLGSGNNVVSGDINGQDTIITGTGNAVISLGHVGSTSTNGNLLREVGAGGTIDISGFLPSAYLGHDSFVLAAGVSATIGTAPGIASSITSTASLSDGTTVIFRNVGQAITNHGGTLYLNRRVAAAPSRPSAASVPG